MSKVLEKIWTELTRIREVRLISYETSKEKDKRLSRELSERITAIRTENYMKVMNERLIPFCRDLELSTSGLLLTDIQLFERAHAMFIQAKKDGRLDGLNNITEVL